jgi:MinD-like ATPase involved in chromosome partitioning or flagellar assembly
MARIISVHSFRGGTGKSNSTANLAVLTARQGYRVGIVDADVQSPGIHALFKLDRDSIARCLNDYLWGRCRIADAAHDVTACAFDDNQPGPARMALFLIPSSLNSAEIGRILREGYDVGLLNDGFRELIHALELDYLFIDTHPGVNEETLLSIAVSDLVLLVLRPDQQDFQGTAVTVELARRLGVMDLLLMINKVPPGTDYQQLRRHVESIYKVEVTAMLPLNTEIAQLASEGVFANRFPMHPFTRELTLLARRIVTEHQP